MKQKKEHPGMECSYKSRSPHNFSMETARGFMGLASARRIVARRIPPPCRVSEREIASAPCENKPFRKPRGEGARSLSRGAIQVGGTNRFGYLLKQIKSTAFFGYLIKTHNMPLIPIKEEEKRHFLRHIICRFTDERIHYIT